MPQKNITIIDIIQTERKYRNLGQHLQQCFIYTMSGIVAKADNIPYSVSADYEDIQVKSARATVCHGLDIEAYLANDAATRYAFVSRHFNKAVIMDKATYIEFVKLFGYQDKDRYGKPIIRLRDEPLEMDCWLELV